MLVGYVDWHSRGTTFRLLVGSIVDGSGGDRRLLGDGGSKYGHDEMATIDTVRVNVRTTVISARTTQISKDDA